MTLDEITLELTKLQNNPLMVTKSMYSPTAHDYPGNRLPFTEIHLAYLRKNKHVDPAHYLSNLRIIIQKR